MHLRLLSWVVWVLYEHKVHDLISVNFPFKQILVSLIGYMLNVKQYFIVYMKKILPILLVVFCAFVSVKQANATHAQAGNITYQYLGDSTYCVFLDFFWNCGVDGSIPAGAPTTASVQINSPCGNLGSVTMALESQVEVTDLQCGVSSCVDPGNVNAEPGTIRYRWKATVKLPTHCNEWTFSYSLCCRNGEITNLDNPGSATFYTESTLDNSSGLNNSSPVFLEAGVPGLCEGDYWEFSFGAVDFDGDSLWYELVAPLDGAGAPIAYVAPFSPTYPIETVQGFMNFDATTGVLSGQPTANFQMAVISVLIHEYRDGVEIGTTRRDVQVITSDDCQDVVAQVEYGGMSVLLGTQTDDSTVSVCAGGVLAVQMSWADTNLLALPTLLGISTLDLIGLSDATLEFENSIQDSIFGTLIINAGPSDTGLHVLEITIEIETDSCLKERQTFNYYINVVPDLELGDSLIYCNTGDSILMTGNDAGNLTWYHINGGFPIGLSSDTINHPFAAPEITTDYVATSDIEGGCKNIDTIRVFTYPVFEMPDTIYNCLDDSLIVVPIWLDSAQMESVNYLWSDNATDSIYFRDENTQTEDSSRFVGVTMDNGTCIVWDSSWIAFTQCFLEIPNVFTPNGDSVNDMFELQHYDAGKWDLVIYNRWGRKVFFESPYENKWGGDNLPDGNYFYRLTHQQLREEYEGWFRLSR